MAEDIGRMFPAVPAGEGSSADLTLNAEVYRICMSEGGYPARWPHHPSCPCCGTGRLRPLFTKQQFNHSQCADCDFVCLDPFPPAPIVRKLYAGSYYTNFREFYEAQYLREAGSCSITAAPLELLERMIACGARGRRHGDWLDVGGGIGTVADLVRRRCPGWTATLNESNPRSLELAREIYGLEVVSDNAERLSDMPRRFDVISAVSVLEHITHPFPFLRSYAQLLKDDGTLIVIVPHFTHLNAAVSKAASPNATPPFHVSLFQRHCFAAIFERVGMFDTTALSEFGPPAFSLLHHYDTSEYWDISIPSKQDPIPKSLKTRGYPLLVEMGLNALGLADPAVGEHFAETDGRLYLMAVARR